MEMIMLRCSIDSGRRGKGILLHEEIQLVSELITGDVIINILKKHALTSGYFSIGYTPFIAIDGRQIGLPVRKAKDLCTWKMLTRNTLIEMSDELQLKPIDIAIIQPSNTSNFLQNNGVIEIRSSTASSDKSILQPNAEYFGCGIIGDNDGIALQRNQELWEAAYNYNASFIYTIKNEMNNNNNNNKHTSKKSRTLKKKSLKKKRSNNNNNVKKTVNANKPWEFVPSFFYPSIEDFADCAAFNCPWIACCPGKGGIPLEQFKHPSRCVYLFGDIPDALVTRCTFHISPPSALLIQHDDDDYNNNNTSIGSVVMYDRYYKRKQNEVRIAKQLEERKRMEIGNGGNKDGNMKKKKKANSHGKRKLRTKGVDTGNYKSLKLNANINTTTINNNNYISNNNNNNNNYKDKREDDSKGNNKRMINPEYLNNGKLKVIVYSEKIFKSRITLYMKEKFHLINMYEKDETKILFDHQDEELKLISTTNSTKISKEEIILKMLNDPIPARAIQTLYCVTNSTKDFDSLCRLIIIKITSIEASISIRIQTKPNDLGGKIIEKLPKDTNLNPKDFTHVLNIIYNVIDDTYLFGLVRRELNFISSPGFTESVNMYRKRHISRSYYKLWEIHRRGCIALNKDQTYVLNVGGAPGWSEYLMLHTKHVTSMSNKKLHVELQQYSNIEHLKMRSEEGMPSYKRLKGIHDNNSNDDNNKQQKYDVILANLNCSPPQAIKTIALFSSLLKENGGVFVLLLKLPAAVKQESANNFYHRLLIEEGIYQVDDVFLFTNSAKETTFIMQTTKRE